MVMLFLIALLLWTSPSWAITLADYQESTFDDTATNEVSGSATWSAGDLIVVLGMTADNSITMGTPTATGLTFSAVSGSPTNVTAQAKGYAWTATAGSSGSGAITVAKSGGGVSAGGISVFVYSSTSGVGGTAFSASLGATTTQSLTRTGSGSHVVQIWGDWNAVNDTTVTWTPSAETQRENSWHSGNATYFAASWGNQGGTGTTSYGFSGFAGGSMTAVTLEILDGAPPTITGCMLLQNGTDKYLLQNGTLGFIFQGGGTCGGGGPPAVVPVRMLMGVGL